MLSSSSPAPRLFQPAHEVLAKWPMRRQRVVGERPYDESAYAGPCGHEAEVLQLFVSLEHRVRIDRHGGHHLFDSRELVVYVEEPQSERVADLLDDLLVRHNSRARVEVELEHPDTIYLGT